jgi:hypothetical protein
VEILRRSDAIFRSEIEAFEIADPRHWSFIRTIRFARRVWTLEKY